MARTERALSRAAERADRFESGSLPPVVLDPEEVLFRQKFVQPGLVDPADDSGFLLAVTDAFGQRERRGDHVEQAEREERAHPSRIVQ